MHSAGIFTLAFFISFIGMIPAGLINSAVMLRALQSGMKPAMVVALGAVLVECAHMLIGIKAIDLLLEEGLIFNVLRWISVAIFTAFAIYFFRKRNHPVDKKGTSRYRSPFIHGLAVSNLNLLAVPFWAFFATWIETAGFVENAWIFRAEIISGAALGSLVTLYLYARMAEWLNRKFDWFQGRINLILAGVFLFLAVFTLYKLIFNS
jgi:threonine/homoserine/homoserine lactone efflux protein